MQRPTGRHRGGRFRLICSVLAVSLVASVSVACTAERPTAAGGRVDSVTITSPATDTVVPAVGNVAIVAAVDGTARSVTASIGGRDVQLSRRGADWTASIAAAEWLVPGRNRIQVATVSGTGRHRYSYRTVYREGAAADLGLAVADSGPADSPAVHVTSTAAVAMVSADLNGHDLTARMRAGVLDQTVPLGGDEGLRPGSNSFTVTAVTATGTFQRATVAVSTVAGAPIAAASSGSAPPVVVTSGAIDQSSTRVRAGQAVPLDASRSKRVRSGDVLSYAWRVTVAPPGAAPTITDPTSVRPTFSADRPGRYVVTVTVSEAGAPSSTDSTILSVTDQVLPVGAPLVTQAPGGISLAGSVVPTVAGQPLQLAVFDRGTLVLLGSAAGGATAASIGSLASTLAAVTSDAQYSGHGVIAVLSAPSGYDCTPVSGACPAFESLLQTLSVDDPKNPGQNDVTIHSGLPFSTITTTAPAGASAVWRSSNVPSSTSPLLPGVAVGRGDLSGYLQYPNGTDPAQYVNDTDQGFTTSSSASTATTNVVQLGDCVDASTTTILELVPATPGMPPCQTLPSTALTTCASSGSTGGFQVVIAWAASLTVVANSTFTTNSGCGADQDQGDAAQLAAMTTLVTQYLLNNGTTDYVVLLQSIGAPRPRTASGAVTTAWSDFGAKTVVPLGGTGSLFDFLGYGSGYSLIGYNDTTLPGFGAPFAAETSSDRPHVGNSVPTAVLSGAFSRNHRNDYVPQTSAPIAGSISNGLAPIATRPPTPWPLEDTPGERATWKYLTQQVVDANGIDWNQDLIPSCWGTDDYSIRGIFCDIARQELTVPDWSEVGSSAPSGVTETDYYAIRTEFKKELDDATAVDTLVTSLSDLFGNSNDTDSVDMNALVTAVETSINAPTTASTRSVWSTFLGIFADAAGLVAGFVGAGKDLQVAGAIVNAIGETMGITGQLIPATDGSAGNLYDQKVQGAASDIAADTGTVYTNVADGIRSLQPIIVTDYGKLTRAANVPLSSDDLSVYLAAIQRGTAAWATPLLLSSVYAVDPLVSAGPGVNSGNTYATGPYTAAVPNFTCYWNRTSYGNNLFTPFPDPPPGSVYLGGSPTQRFVLSGPGDPGDGNVVPRQAITPDLPPASILATMFAPVTSSTDVTHLGLVQAHTFTRVFGLTGGTTVSCPVSPGLPGGAVAAAASNPGDQGVFYTMSQQPRGTYQLWSDTANTADGTWGGPTLLPGTPDHDNSSGPVTPMAATSNEPGTTNVFFLQKGKLVNDYFLAGGPGWQGPGPLPGSPDNVDQGGTIAATAVGSANYVFFWQKQDIVYDVDTGNGWTGPFTAVSGAALRNSETPLAATVVDGAPTVFYERGNDPVGVAMGATLTNSTWISRTVAIGIDEGSPFAAVTPAGGAPTLIVTSGSSGGSTNLVAFTWTGSSWTSLGTVASGLPVPVSSITASSYLPNEMDVYLIPPNGDQHNVVGRYRWTPSTSWQPQPDLPVPSLVGQYP